RPRLRPRSARRLRAHGRLDRAGPPRVRDLPHPHAVPGHADVPPDGCRGPAAPQGLAALRHGPRRLPPPPPVARGARTGLRLVLRDALLAPIDLATQAGRRARRAGLPGDVVPLQAIEPILAPADPAPADGAGVAPAGRVDAPAAPEVPPRAG